MQEPTVIGYFTGTRVIGVGFFRTGGNVELLDVVKPESELATLADRRA